MVTIVPTNFTIATWMSEPSFHHPSGVAKGERLTTGDVTWEMCEGGKGRIRWRHGTSRASDGKLGPVEGVATCGRAGGVGRGASSTTVCMLEEALPFSSIICWNSSWLPRIYRMAASSGLRSRG